MTTKFTMYSKTAVAKNGNKFIVHTAKINGIWYNVKFRRTVEGVPTRAGIYTVRLNSDDASVQPTEYIDKKTGDVKNGTTVLWIHEVISIDRESDEAMKERNSRKMEAIFTEDNLPF